MNQDAPILGILAVEHGLLSQANLDKALDELGKDASDLSLSEYLEEKQLVSEKNLECLSKAAKILDIRQKEFRFGSMVVRLGFMNKSIVNLALNEQQQAIRNRKKPQLIGDMLVGAGFLTARQRNYVLTLQKRKKIENFKSLPPLKDQEAELPVDNTCVSVSQYIVMEDIPEESQILSSPVTILPGLRLQVAEDGMAAYLTKASGFDRDMQVPQLKEALKKQSIVFGLLPDEMLGGFIESSGFRTKSFKVAKGIVPKANHQVQIEYFFPADIFTPGELDAEGRMDYKERGKIVQVPKGAVLAKKIISQAETSASGFDIYGNTLAPGQAEQEMFISGPGTRLSSDGLQIIADIKGRPRRLLSGEIKVIQAYVQEGDVGYKSGHVDYDGDVHIKGGKDRFVHEELESYKKQLADINQKLDSEGGKKQALLDYMQNLQDEVTRLAHEQDISRRELKEHEKQLDQLAGTGREDKMQDIEYQMSRLKRNMDYIEKKLDKAFEENEEVEQQAEELDKILKQSMEDLELIRNSRKKLIQWSLAVES